MARQAPIGGSSAEPHIQRICPPVSELDMPIRTNIPCTQSGCNKVFQQSAALRFHLQKVHKIEQETAQCDVRFEEGAKLQFYCPVASCRYHLGDNLSNSSFFPNKKNLRMHYLRCHTSKNFKCPKEGCGRSYCIEKDLRVHIEECGQEFACVNCSSVFDTRKSYMTHCLRQDHPVRTDIDLRGKRVRKPTASKSKDSENCRDKTANAKPNERLTSKHAAPQYIVPKPNIMVLSVELVTPPAATEQSLSPSTTKGLSTLPGGTIIPKQVLYFADARPPLQKVAEPMSVVTDFLLQNQKNTSQSSTESNSLDTKVSKSLREQKCTRCGNLHFCEKHTTKKSARHPNTPKFSTSTQTINSTKHKQAAAQTQTTGDFILKKAMQFAEIPTNKESRGSQVSPRAKLKRHSSSAASVQTSQTQTVGSPRSMKKRKCKKAVQVQDTATTTTTAVEPQRDSLHLVPQVSILTDSTDLGSPVKRSLLTNTENFDDGYTLSIPDNPWMSVADTQTQTMALLDELQATLGESHSTQTLDSYLLAGKEKDSPPNQRMLSQGMSSTAAMDENRTVDQAVLCDLGFSTSLVGSTRSMACSPIFNMSGNDTMDMGTDPLFDTQYPLLLPESSSSFSMSAQTDIDCDTQGDTNTGTQTAIGDVDFPVLLTSGVQTSDFDSMYMNIETQTIDSESNMIDQFLNNMQTQTNEDFLADFSFCDIETQTPLTMSVVKDYMALPSTSLMGAGSAQRQEIQTQTSLHTLNHSGASAISTDMQTQTLFHNVNTMNPGLADSFTQTAFTEVENIMDDLTK